MQSDEHESRLDGVREFTDVAPGDTPAGMATVQRYLVRFGYLTSSDVEDGVFDEPSAAALETFQRLYGLEPTSRFDAATKALMQQPSCGVPDLNIGIFARFALRCCWRKTFLSFAFDTGSDQVDDAQAFDAVRAAITTWEDVGRVTFSEVGINDSPDFLIGWRPADDPDLSMVGSTIAHADFPTGCSVVINGIPKPVHFDDTEATWDIGAVPGAHDIETTALHEIGHILGLGHSTDPAAVMYRYINRNSTKRSLTSDELQGLAKLYPSVPFVRERLVSIAAEMVRAVGLVPEFSGPIGSRAWVWRQSPLPGRSAPCNGTVKMQSREGPIP